MTDIDTHCECGMPITSSSKPWLARTHCLDCLIAQREWDEAEKAHEYYNRPGLDRTEDAP